MIYSFNKRQRIIRRAKRHLERAHDLTLDLHNFGSSFEAVNVILYIEELFPVHINSPKGHGL